MPTLLSIVASPRGEYSISRALTNAFVDEWKKTHQGEVITRDLVKTTLPFVDLPWIAGAYTPEEKHSPEMKKALEVSNELIAELKAADHIVFGVPMYNFQVPANVKAYIDQVTRVNVTFTPTYEGLLKNKKTTVLIASAGTYTPGAYAESYNQESGYLKQILGFIGLTDVSIVLAGGTSAVDTGTVSREDLLAGFIPTVVEAAR